MAAKKSTVDPDEVARFSRIADEWWNPGGKFKPLHRMNPVRIGWVIEQVSRQGSPQAAPLQGLSVLDVGCGGGLVAEPMARLGAAVTAIDASEKNIAVAALHAEQSGLAIDYRCATAEEMLAGGASFDVVLALEIVEHVADVEAFLAAVCGLVKPGGTIILSTLNRTPKAFALAIAGAEYVLRLLPRGTHDWRKFLRPSELCAGLRRNGVEPVAMSGMVMHPLTGEWRLDAKDLSVNYLVAGRKG